MNFLNGMFSVCLYFESTPLDSDGYDSPYTLRSEGCNDNIGAVSGIFGFNLDIKIGLSVNIDFGYKFC